MNKEGIGGSTQRKINEAKAREQTGMISGGSWEINKYELRSLWKGMAVPQGLYGAEITNYRKEDIRKLETIQNFTSTNHPLQSGTFP